MPRLGDQKNYLMVSPPQTSRGFFVTKVEWRDFNLLVNITQSKLGSCRGFVEIFVEVGGHFSLKINLIKLLYIFQEVLIWYIIL
jgi:hypothetical protein